VTFQARPFALEEPVGVVKYKPVVQLQLEDPARWFAGSIKVDFTVSRGQIMSETLHFERCSAADCV